MLKTCSYCIDTMILTQPKMTCLLLCVQNILIALVDGFLEYLLDILFYSRNHRYSRFTLLCVLVEEMPNYVFALVFNSIEYFFVKSFKPYFDIAALLYFFTGLLICHTNLQDMLRFEYENAFERHKHNEIENKSDFLIIKSAEDITAFHNYLHYTSLDKQKHLKIDDINKLIQSKPYNYKMALYITKIVNTSLDTLIYFFLMSELREQSYLVMYFSVNFLFKMVDVKITPPFFVRFMCAKYFVSLLAAFSIFYFNVFGNYLFLTGIFLLNGLTNEIVYKGFEKCCGKREVVLAEFAIFGFVSCFVLYFGQKPDESFEDFIFFSSVRL